MKNGLIFLESALQYNHAFVSYVKREIKRHVGELETIHFIKKGEDDIVVILEELIAEHRNLFVVTHESFSFAGKIIATICHDGLVLKDEMLIPMKAEKSVKNSYLIKKGSTAINVLKVDPLEKLPQFLIHSRSDFLTFYLFDAEAAHAIEAEISQLEMHYVKVELAEGLLFYRVGGMHISQFDVLLGILDRAYRYSVLVGEDLAQIVCSRLIEGGRKITTAESCTGGMLASEIVKNSGVSAVYDGGIVSYANEVKHDELGVKAHTLEKYGAVSKECVQEMLQGVMQKFGADFALAVSGIAGPGGGTRYKPVGTVYVGAKCSQKERIIKRLQLKGDRTYIREQSVLWAFRLLVETNREFFFKKIEKTLDK